MFYFSGEHAAYRQPDEVRAGARPYPTDRQLPANPLFKTRRTSVTCCECHFANAKCFLWVGTGPGLTRFDGRHFTTVEFSPEVQLATVRSRSGVCSRVCCTFFDRRGKSPAGMVGHASSACRRALARHLRAKAMPIPLFLPTAIRAYGSIRPRRTNQSWNWRVSRAGYCSSSI